MKQFAPGSLQGGDLAKALVIVHRRILHRRILARDVDELPH